MQLASPDPLKLAAALITIGEALDDLSIVLGADTVCLVRTGAEDKLQYGVVDRAGCLLMDDDLPRLKAKLSVANESHRGHQGGQHD